MKKTLLCLTIALTASSFAGQSQLLPDAAAADARRSPRLTVERLTQSAAVPVIERTVSLTPDPSARTMARGMRNVAKFPGASELKVIARAPMPDPTLKFWGAVGYSDHNEAGTMNAHRGFYEIDGAGNFTKLDSYPVSSAPSQPCAYTDDGRVIMLGNNNTYRVFSATTWEETTTLSYSSRDYNLYSVTWDPFTRCLLACVTNLGDNKSDCPYQLVTIDPATMRRVVMADLAVPLYSIAVDPAGKIYALSQDFNFMTYDRDGKSTLIKEKIVPFVLDKAFGGGAMTWDPFNGRLLTGIRGESDEPMASADPFPGCLYAIDPATGDAQMIVQFTYNDEITGMTFPGGIYSGSAPEKATAIVTEFTAGSMNGQVSFTAPLKAVDGSQLVPPLTYYICADGKQMATGTVEPGKNMSVSVIAPESGEHAVTVQMENGSGRGKVDGNTIFIGADVPCAPVSLSASFSGSGLMMLSWPKVENSANGGYVNPDEVLYSIVRYNRTNPDEEPVEWAETKLTSWSAPMQEPETLTDYQFGITATFEGKTSPETLSNIVRAGCFTAPYSYGFPDGDEFTATFTCINYNGESYGGNWEWSYDGWGDNKNGYVRCRRAYGASGEVDKWIVTPGFRFEKDKVYRFDIDVKTNGNNYNERIEVLVGTNPDSPETWTTYIIEPTDFSGSQWRTLTGYITVPSNDRYYVGIHACTPADRSTYYISLDNLSIGQAVNATSPGSVSDVTVEPGPYGTHYSDISFVTPTKNFMQTEDLTSLTSVDVYRNGELAKSFASPALGTRLAFRDDNLTPGAYTYRFVTRNDNGEGPDVTVETYVGVRLPARPDNVMFEENPDKPGEVTITWDAVTTDETGASIPAGYVSYSVVELQGSKQVFIDDVKDATSYTYQAVGPDDMQQFKRYAIFAETESGTGYGLASVMKPVGKDCRLPFTESFADAGVSNPIAIENDAWGTLMDGDIQGGPVAVDGDNGYACMIATNQDQVSDLITGKISLEGARNPYLTFWTYNIVPATGDPDLNEYRIIVDSDGEETALKSFAIAQECRLEGWNRVLVDLKRYAGKTIQVRFRAKAVNFAFTLLDDVRIYDAPDHDLIVKEFSTPAEVKAEKDFKMRVVIENYGAVTENDYTINIYRDGEKVLTAPGKTVSPTQTVFADFTTAMPVMVDAGGHKYHAEIELDGDANPDDNRSYEATVRLKHPKYPVVDDLSGRQEGADVNLTWTRPEIKRVPDMMTEDFEGFDSLTQDFDEWSTMDEDGYPIYGFQDFIFPGILKGAPQSWFVIDNSLPEFDGINSFGARSGTKCLMQFLSEDGACDDWLISPALYGKAQEIDFYARNYYMNDKCEFEFLYSTTEPSDVWGFAAYQFTAVARVNVYSENWTHYTFEVPDGAKYFAVRANTNNGVILMVDDFTFRPLGNSDLTLKGYNVYHNGEKLNDKPVAKPSFVHERPDVNADHVYAVTAVYSKGESVPVMTSVAMNGLGGVSADNMEVSVDGRNIIVSNAALRNVTVATPSGMTVYSGTGALRTVIPVAAPGVYLVYASEKAFKVVVR